MPSKETIMDELNQQWYNTPSEAQGDQKVIINTIEMYHEANK